MIAIKHLPRLSTVISKLAAFSKVSLFGALALYLALSPLNRPLYETILFQPATKYPGGSYDTKDIIGIPKQDVSFRAVDGSVLHGWYFKNPGARQVALVHHGQGNNLTVYSPFVQEMLHHGMSAFIYDYRGYGKSQGTPTVGGIVEDGESAFKYLVDEKKFRPRDIVQLGISLGTGVACNVAHDHPGCAGVILLSPYANLNVLARDRLSLLTYYPYFLFSGFNIDATRLFAGEHPPVLMFHGERDEQIPIHNADDLAACSTQPCQYVRLRKAGHTDFFWSAPKETEKAISDFFAKLHPTGRRSQASLGTVEPIY